MDLSSLLLAISAPPLAAAVAPLAHGTGEDDVLILLAVAAAVLIGLAFILASRSPSLPRPNQPTGSGADAAETTDSVKREP
jgi:hypothetical protein